MNLNDFHKKISYLSEADKELVQKAFEFAQNAHQGQERASGEPYFSHVVAAAEILADMRVDATTLCAALLHDVLEDTKTKAAELEKEFGEEITFLVQAISKLGYLKYRGQEREIENFRKMFLAMAKDIRVMLIKLADRLHNMRTIEWLPKNKQERIAKETLEIYAPLASRLGMGHFKGELEDLCFPILYPGEYHWLNKQVSQQFEERKVYLEKLKPIVEQELRKEKITFLEINLRAKHYWSLWRKLKRYEMDWGKIYDLVAARIIVPTVADCYATLGVLHKLWAPLPGRIKDYIATPRPSGYQSLHTTVFAHDGQIVEFQIRTPEMHEAAEKGIAAHWLYDEYTKHKKQHIFKPHQLAWIRQLRDWQETLGEKQSEEFIKSLKIDFFQDRIFVFTPKGDVIDLPEGATPIDFAYQVHSDLGNSCTGARVNGKMAALSDALQNSDVIEIITTKNKKPSKDWLNFVKTSEARRKIQQVLGIVKPSAQRKNPRKIQFRIVVQDRIGITRDIASIFSKNNANIESSTSGAGQHKKQQVMLFNVIVPRSCRVDELLKQLQRIKSVQKCESIIIAA